MGWVRRNIQRVAAAQSIFAIVRLERGTCAAICSVTRLVISYTARRLCWPVQRVGLFRAVPAIRVSEPVNETVADAANHGILFIGYVEAGLGLGESLRGLLGSVADTMLPFAVYPFSQR